MILNGHHYCDPPAPPKLVKEVQWTCPGDERKVVEECGVVWELRFLPTGWAWVRASDAGR